MDKFQLMQAANGERPIADNIEELERHDALRAQWIADHIEGTKVIDIGCSTGFMASLIGDDVKYVGLDYNKEVIDYAKELYKGNPNVQFQNVSLQNMHFVDTKIADTIIAAEVIEHLENGLDYIPKLRKMCKRLILTVPNRQWWKWQHHALENLTEQDFNGGDIYYYDVKNLKITREPIVYVRPGEWTNMLIIFDDGVEYPQPETKKSLTAYICTKGRSLTTLPLAIQSILYQTRKPDVLFILDDNIPSERIEYDKHPLYTTMLNIARSLGISVEILFSPGEVGPATNHQYMLERCNTDLLLRVDDDDSYMPNTIEILVSKIEEGYAAVAPFSPFANQPLNQPPWYARGILSNPVYNCTPQFYVSDKDIVVEHLNNTFMIDVKAIKNAGIRYAQGLSPVAHTEETRFSHDIFRAGLPICVAGNTLCWHYQYPSGGIRSTAYRFFWEADEREYYRYLEPFGYAHYDDVSIPVLLEHGYGDTIMFVNLISELSAKYFDKQIIIGTNFKEIFEYHKIEETFPNVKIVTTHDFKLIYWYNVQGDPIYKWMSKNKWQGHILDAYREIYIHRNIWEVRGEIR